MDVQLQAVSGSRVIQQRELQGINPSPAFAPALSAAGG